VRNLSEKKKKKKKKKQKKKKKKKKKKKRKTKNKKKKKKQTQQLCQVVDFNILSKTYPGDHRSNVACLDCHTNNNQMFKLAA